VSNKTVLCELCIAVVEKTHAIIFYLPTCTTACTHSRTFTHIHTHAHTYMNNQWTTSMNKKAGLDVMQNHSLHRTHFN